MQAFAFEVALSNPAAQIFIILMLVGSFVGDYDKHGWG